MSFKITINRSVGIGYVRPTLCRGFAKETLNIFSFPQVLTLFWSTLYITISGNVRVVGLFDAEKSFYRIARAILYFLA